MLVLLAIIPILVVLVGMIGFKKPAIIVAPVAMVITIIMGMAFFQTSGATVSGCVKKGLIDGFRIIWVIWGAFAMLLLMQNTGAMDKIKESIVVLTKDRRVHVLLIAVMLGAFIEGAAGAGTPAAIAAPFLVGLGFNPIIACAACLIANGIPPCWGAAGGTTIMGALTVSDYITIGGASAMTGKIVMIGALTIPWLVTTAVFGKKAWKGFIPFMLFVGVVFGTVFGLFSSFSTETTSLAAGFITLIATVIYLKVIGVPDNKDFAYENMDNIAATTDDDSESNVHSISSIQAFSPYIVLIILLPVIRYTVPMEILCRYGYPMWIGAVIFGSVIIGGLILKDKISNFFIYAKDSLIKVFPALVAMCSLLILSTVMIQSGMMSLLAQSLADVSGAIYPVVAIFIGSLGSFMTGSGVGSNIIFAPLHMEAATQLAYNPYVLFAAQNVGGAIGNLICPNNLLAVAATVGILGSEGTIMRKTIPSFVMLFILYAVITMLYCHCLFA